MMVCEAHPSPEHLANISTMLCSLNVASEVILAPTHCEVMLLALIRRTHSSGRLPGRGSGMKMHTVAVYMRCGY